MNERIDLSGYDLVTLVGALELLKTELGPNRPMSEAVIDEAIERLFAMDEKIARLLEEKEDNRGHTNW